MGPARWMGDRPAFRVRRPFRDGAGGRRAASQRSDAAYFSGCEHWI